MEVLCLRCLFVSFLYFLLSAFLAFMRRANERHVSCSYPWAAYSNARSLSGPLGTSQPELGPVPQRAVAGGARCF